MNITPIFLAFALTSSPAPAPNYYSWISPEIANEITDCVLKGEYREYLDFNGDNTLSIADVVGVSKRYKDNITYGNKITVDREVIESIIEENYLTDCLYWEIDFVNDKPTRQYELTVDEITTANIYFEFIDDTVDNVKIEINPFEERVTVVN
jgi:hypothetical protein